MEEKQSERLKRRWEWRKWGDRSHSSPLYLNLMIVGKIVILKEVFLTVGKKKRIETDRKNSPVNNLVKIFIHIEGSNK